MENAINMINISKDYPNVRALDDISFHVKKGSIHGFLGPNGAGKSTAMNIITGLIPPNKGRVEINGKDIRKNLSYAKSKIGFLPENPPLYEDMRVDEYLYFVARIHVGSIRQLKKRINEVMRKCGLETVTKRLIGNLSKGFKQRIGIAQALIYEPEIIIMDEPTVGLDPISIREIRELILSLKDDHTILLSSHQLHEINLICSDITIIHKGRIIQSSPIDKLHREFQTKQIIMAEVARWDDSMAYDIHEQFPCETLEVTDRNNSVVLKFFSLENGDVRSKLSRFLVQKGCDLLAFREERLDLEDIFRIATKVE